MSNAPQEEQEIARVKICDALSRAAKPRANFTREEWKAYSDLRKDQSIRILQADKCNATVLLDKEEYDRKVLDLIGDRKVYEILKKRTPCLKVISKK